jgi:predicted transcriptional regulator
MTVNDITTERILICPPEANLAAATAVLWDSDCGALPVLDLDGKVVGIATHRQISIALGIRHTGLSDLVASDVLEVRLVTGKRSDHMGLTLPLKREAKVRRLPVVNQDGSIEHIVSLDDRPGHLRWLTAA